MRTPARRQTAAIAAKGAAIVLVCCLAAAISAAGFRLMSRTAAAGPASHHGRRPDSTAPTGHPDSSGARPLAHFPAPPPQTCSARAALLAALRPVLRHRTGMLAVGVADPGTGVTASYHPRQPFHTASIVKADILATLLLQLQRQHAALSQYEQDLATAMIEDSDNNAADGLWNIIGATQGLAAGDQVLRLRHTVPGPGGWWGLTSTTVTDQLRLLSALTSRSSPLTGASRRYELTLMRDVVTGQNWGATAAAGRRTRPAVKNGWMPDAPLGLWVINSIGVVSHARQTLLIAVLSGDQPSESSGIRQVQATAIAAAAAITARVP